MIKFFRKIRLNLLSERKTGKYFKYAIGEIILVVVGILIALQVNNANENRKKDARVQIFLTNLKTQIDKNSANAKNYLEDNEYYLTYSKRLLIQVDDKNDQLNEKQLDTLIFMNALDFFINLETIVLEEGKVNGDLALVQSDALRQSLYRFIKTYDIYKEREKVINQDLSLNFKPYLNKHYNIRNLIQTAGYSDLGDSPFTNKKIVKIVEKPEFENHITTRIMLQEDMVNSTEELVVILDEVKKHLDSAIKK